MSRMGQQRFPLVAAGVFGITGVGLGALGAHAMAGVLAEHGMAHAWETGARYHVFHAVALLGLAAWARTAAEPAVRRVIWAARCWSIGIILFSGSLYGIAVGGPRWLGPITPLGGVALLAGWVFVIAAALAPDAHDNS
jgi:uncharacterized membrane protein YgdD (TMEM256/DUF423 family)